MLFIQSNSLPLALAAAERTRLVEALAERGRAPFIRSQRRRLFRALAAGVGDAAAVESAARELEREAESHATERGPFVPGELFLADDCVLALLFEDGAGGGLCASVVYNVETVRPLARLEDFC